MYLHGSEKMEADDAIASANALLAATAAREGLCSSPAEIQADGTLRWNSIYCKHYLFGRCARRRCRFVHGDRETVMQQRRLLEMATAAAAEVAATFESQIGCSTHVTGTDQLESTGACESYTHSVSIQNASGRLQSSPGLKEGVTDRRVAQVAGTNVVVAGSEVTDVDADLYSKQKMQSRQHLQGRGLVNVNFATGESSVCPQTQHRGGARSSGCARRETVRGAGSAVTEMSVATNPGLRTGRTDHATAFYAAEKHAGAPRLLPTGKTRLQSSKSSDNPSRIALSTEEHRSWVDNAGGRNRPLPQMRPLSSLQPQQQRLVRVPSAPCRSQPIDDCYRHTLSGVRRSLVFEHSKGLHPVNSFTEYVQEIDRPIRPHAYGVPSVVYTRRPPGCYTREQATGGMNYPVSRVEEALKTPRMIPTWKPSTIQPDASRATATNSNVLAASLKSRSGALPSIASFAATAHKYKVAEGGVENLCSSRASQLSNVEPSKLGADVVNADDFYILVGESKAGSSPAPSLVLSRNQSVSQPSQQGQQMVPSTYRLFDFAPQDEKGDCEAGRMESTKIPMYSSSKRLSGWDKLLTDAGELELRSHSEHRLSSGAKNRPGFSTACGKSSRKKIAPIGRVDPVNFRLESSVVDKLSLYRALSQHEKPCLPAMLPQHLEYQKDTLWHTGEANAEIGSTATRAGDTSMTGDIRFVQAAESLSERYCMPFLCVFVPQRGYAIQFLEEATHCMRSASGLTPSCSYSEHLNKTISEVVKSVLNSYECVLSSPSTPVKRLPPTDVAAGKVCDSATTALALNQITAATQLASTTSDRLHALDQSGLAGLPVFTSSGLLWNTAHTEQHEKEADKSSVDAVAQDIGRSSTLIESSGAPTASLLSVLSSLPELDLLETKTLGAGSSSQEAQPGNGVFDQVPASPLNLTSWLERQQSNGQPKRRFDPFEDRSFTLLSTSAGQNPGSACPESANQHTLTATEYRSGSAPAVSDGTPATRPGESPKKSAKQAVEELSGEHEAVRTQKMAEQGESLQVRKNDNSVNHAVMHLLTLRPEAPAPTSACPEAPQHEPDDDTQQQISWQLWPTTLQSVKSSPCTGQGGGDNSEGNNRTPALWSFWSRTASGSLLSSHQGRAGTSGKFPEKDDEDNTVCRTVLHQCRSGKIGSTGLRYTTATVHEKEKKRTTKLQACSATQWNVTSACPKASAQSIYKAGQWQHAAPRSQSVSGCEGTRVQHSAQRGIERGGRWKRSATAGELWPSPRCVVRALTQP